MHAHVHCLRSEQCTCTCNKSLLDSNADMFDQVLDQTNNKRLLARVKDKARGSSAGGLKVKALA